jgi:serine/threonine protein kinase
LNQITQFGPYKLIERISVGGMAEVYKATEHGVEGFERTVAVKRILPHIAEDDEFITMFKDEAKIAGQLNHGNIAQIYNLGQQGDSFYIALEYVAGKDLRNIFTRCQQQGRPMPIAQACFVVMKICEGLDYAHNKRDKHGRHLNIVHRDVSPPNILVSYEGEVKLIDFGVAKAAGRVSRTQAGILKGKFGYMSPEQVRGMPLDRRSDVFSLGVVLYEVLVGNRLFQGDTDFATLEMVRTVDVARAEQQERRDLEGPRGDHHEEPLRRAGDPLPDRDGAARRAPGLHVPARHVLQPQGPGGVDAQAVRAGDRAREGQERRQGPAAQGAASGRRRRPQADRAADPRRQDDAPPAAAPPAAKRTIPPPSAPVPSPSDSIEPTEEQLAAARKRSKTMLMSPSNRPSTLKPGSPPTGSLPTVPKNQDPLKATIVPGGAPPPAVVAPKPVAPPKAAPVARSAENDLDWDDDELETKLFDDPPGARPGGAPAGKKQRPEELGPLPPPQAPQAGQIEEEEDNGPATVQLPPNAAAVIIQPLLAGPAGPPGRSSPCLPAGPADRPGPARHAARRSADHDRRPSSRASSRTPSPASASRTSC